MSDETELGGSNARIIFRKLIRWWLFTGLFSLIPLVASYAMIALRAKGAVPVSAASSHGELLLIASAMCAAGAGEVFGTREKWAEAKLISGGLAVVIIAGATFLYAAAMTDIDAASLFRMSVWLFAGAWVVSSSCVALSEVR